MISSAHYPHSHTLLVQAPQNPQKEKTAIPIGPLTAPAHGGRTAAPRAPSGGSPGQRSPPILEGLGARSAGSRSARLLRRSRSPEPKRRPDRSPRGPPQPWATAAWKISSRWSTGCRTPSPPLARTRTSTCRRSPWWEARARARARCWRISLAGKRGAPRSAYSLHLGPLGLRPWPRRRRDLTAPGAAPATVRPPPPARGRRPSSFRESPSEAAAPPACPQTASGHQLLYHAPSSAPSVWEDSALPGDPYTGLSPIPHKGTEGPELLSGSLRLPPGVPWRGNTPGAGPPTPRLYGGQLLPPMGIPGQWQGTPPITPGRGHSSVGIKDQAQPTPSHTHTSAAPAAIRAQRGRGGRRGLQDEEGKGGGGETASDPFMSSRPLILPPPLGGGRLSKSFSPWSGRGIVMEGECSGEQR